MNILRFFFVFTLSILAQNTTSAQEWVNYQSQQQINDLVDTGNELLMATDAGLVVMNKTTLEKTIFNKANSNLSNNHIQTITQTEIGEIWIGTYDAIMMRFDGTNFQDGMTPQHNEYNPESTELYVFKIAPNGDLWLGTSDGIFRKQNQDWLHYDNTDIGDSFFKAWDIEINDNGEVFVASIGLFKFANEQWTNISNGTQLEGYLGADFFFNSVGDLYFAGDLDQVGRFDGVEWQAYDIQLNGSQVLRFTEDANGEMYFQTVYDGIFKLTNNDWTQQANEQAQAFDNNIDYFYIDGQNNHWMNNNIYLTVSNNGNIQSTTISNTTLEISATNDVHKGANGKMYFIVSSSSELAVLDTEGNWSSLSLPSSGETFEYFNDILVLTEHDIWLASNQGYYHYDGNEWAFTSAQNCSGIVADSQGKIYVLNNESVYMIDNATTTEYNTNNSPLSSLILSGHGLDANDNLWIASFSWEGEDMIQKVSTDGTWTSFTNTDLPAINRAIGDFHTDHNGHLWIPLDYGGAIKFDGTTWTNPLVENSEDISELDVYTIKSDANGKLYFVNEQGVITFFDGVWETLVIEDIRPVSHGTKAKIEFDNEGTLWWASNTYGVFSFTPEGINLAVELFPFEAKLTSKNEVQLDWATASEINNDFFIIERSKDAFIWEMVEKVAGKGTTNDNNYYRTVDRTPYQGTSFYRLKQVDKNGTVVISPIQLVTIENLNIQIYPNPTTDFLHINLKEGSIQTIALFNHLGQDVTAQVSHSTGNTENIQLHLKQLTSGYYYLVVNAVVVQKIFKQ